MSTDAKPLLHGVPAAPPPYGTSNHHHYHHHGHGHQSHGVAYVPHHHPVPVVLQPQIPGTVVVVRDRPRHCRFCKAFIIAIMIWVLFGALLRHLLWHPRYIHTPPHQWSVGPSQETPDYDIPPGIDLIACDEPLKDAGGPSYTSFEVASSSDAIFLLSAGSWLQGSVKVTTSANADAVKFTVKTSLVRWRGSYRTADTIVCSLKRNDGENGVGIFNPVRPYPYDNHVRYEVLVELPENHPIIKRFETNVVNALHDIDDLREKIFFENLSLRGSNAGIKATALFAQWASISTSNGAIDGYFNASDDLTITTSNAHVDIDVDFNQEKSSRAKLSITTTNGFIKASLGLHDFTTVQASNPNFEVVTQTENAALDVTFKDAPVDSLLTHTASTSNARAHVSLHPTYEGHFTLSSNSAWINPVVKENEVEDPAGRGRSRSVHFRNVRGFVDGDVAWVSSTPGRKGTVDVKTSNARITLDL